MKRLSGRSWRLAVKERQQQHNDVRLISSDCTAFLPWRQYKCTTEGLSWTKCYFGDKKEHRLTASHFSESQAVIFPPTDTRSPYRREVILSSWRALLSSLQFHLFVSQRFCSLSRSAAEVSVKFTVVSSHLLFLWFLFYLLSLAFVKHAVFVCLLYINTSHLITDWK